MAFEIVQAGMLSLIQDNGRNGYAELGLTQGGPMDPLSFYWANRLCSNPLEASSVEVTFGGLQLVCHQDCTIAITGAPLKVLLDDQAMPMWSSFTVKAGQKLELGHPAKGVRSYLAVSGGFKIKPQFGSTSTVVREQIGGLAGKALAKGDRLPGEGQIQPHQMLPFAYRPKFSQQITLRLIAGYQQKLFSSQQKRRLFNSEYRVTDQCDRMGYRLSGEKVNASSQQLVSEGICLGAVQFPADGQPIVMMNDHQTIGGYPKMGAVLSLDLAQLAQCQRGAIVRFVAVEIGEAQQLLKEQFDKIRQQALVPVS
ncbi:biotin-dependent carboxyltransferase family protein [Neptunicella sp. SCSIO 80796]|uniref:5-oxoprolinase subunit C family protein n=1 Tax=Neptunicella plasticusilytica TaxID=3117012 RepID=UPI003A4DD41F